MYLDLRRVYPQESRFDCEEVGVRQLDILVPISKKHKVDNVGYKSFRCLELVSSLAVLFFLGVSPDPNLHAILDVVI
jgi:hypothetical protein